MATTTNTTDQVQRLTENFRSWETSELQNMFRTYEEMLSDKDSASGQAILEAVTNALQDRGITVTARQFGYVLEQRSKGVREGLVALNENAYSLTETDATVWDTWKEAADSMSEIARALSTSENGVGITFDIVKIEL